MRKTGFALIAAAASTVLVAGCGSTAASSSGPSGSGSGSGAATGPGVTSSTIKLGYLDDRSGPGSGAGKVLWQGSQLYVDQLNKNGGVCGRHVDLQVQDTGYDPQKALSLYQQSSTGVLGYMAILGTPILSQLGTRISQDNILTITQSWDPALLKTPNFIVAPSPSDMDVVAGLGYLAQQGVLKSGDTVGAIYMPGLGKPQMAGVDYAASKLGLKTTKIEVQPTATDLSSQLQQFASEKAKAIVVAGLPTQTAAAAAGEEAAGLDVPVVTGTAGFVDSLTTGDAASAVEKHTYVILGWSPFSANNPQVKQVVAAYEANKGGVIPDAGIIAGWSQAKIYTDIIAKSCDNLTRGGLMTAYRSITDESLPGLMPDLNFSKPGQPPARAYNITQPSASEPGGLKLISKPFITPDLLQDYAPNGS